MIQPFVEHQLGVTSGPRWVLVGPVLGAARGQAERSRRDARDAGGGAEDAECFRQKCSSCRAPLGRGSRSGAFSSQSVWGTPRYIIQLVIVINSNHGSNLGFPVLGNHQSWLKMIGTSRSNGSVVGCSSKVEGWCWFSTGGCCEGNGGQR